jgi:NAD(P)-dependent dehydrogenase (short-subunit alcohol dehydrogenase family)
MDLKLENKLALVTGSTAGIGLAIARALAAQGTRVIINGRSEQRVADAKEAIRKAVPTAELQSIAVDLGKTAGASEAIRRFPDLDVLVNNLGVYEPKSFEKSSLRAWRKRKASRLPPSRRSFLRRCVQARCSSALQARMRWQQWSRLLPVRCHQQPTATHCVLKAAWCAQFSNLVSHG